MSFSVAVSGTEIRFDCGADETVLDAAGRAGYDIPYSCRNGVCTSCRGEVLAGKVDRGRDAALSAAEREEGSVLFCQAQPRSDLDIRPRRISKTDPNARKTVAAKVFRLTRATADVALLQLRFPAGTRVKFKAGQYLHVLLDGGERRSFSMANPPQESDGAQLHIRHVPGGRFTDRLFSGALNQGDTLRVELPDGDFHLRDGESPVLLVASGTGFAPIKSIVEDAAKRRVARDMTLYWGARRRDDLYLPDLPKKWAAQNERFRFVPVLSEEGWAGRQGFVHRAVLEDHRDLAAFEAYACGVPAMTTAARRDFTAAGLPPDRFFCDAFVTPADLET